MNQHDSDGEATREGAERLSFDRDAGDLRDDPHRVAQARAVGAPVRPDGDRADRRIRILAGERGRAGLVRDAHYAAFLRVGVMQNRGFARVTGRARAESDFFRGCLRAAAGAETEGENDGKECDERFHIDSERCFMSYYLPKNKRSWALPCVLC